MSDFIQSANALVSRVAKWVGAIPKSTGISATDITDGVITVSTDPTALIMVGDFIGVSPLKGFCVVTEITSGTITVNDPDGMISDSDLPATLLMLPTQSTIEITQSIQMGELKMRKLELPALRTDPYSTIAPTTLTTDAQGMAPIPADMNKPILFFQQGTSGEQTSTGPWIVYDRVGDRDIITMGLIAKLYLQPVNTPMVIRGKFSEVGSNYQFLPYLAEGTQLNLYYYRAWQLLFTPIYQGETQVGTVQTNEVLRTWPEGYIYGALHEYYVKRHSADDAAMYKAKFDEAWRVVEYQNSLGKWSGGHTRMISVFQPRRDRQYAVK